MLQIFNYNNSNVSFRNEEGNVYVNATEMAKPFNKDPYSYIRNASTKEFIDALSQSADLRSENLIQTQNGGSNSGTWMHEDVALDFAQWLSPVFRVWCNQKIKQLLTTGTATIKSPEEVIAEGYRLAIAKVEQLEQSNKLLTATIKEQAPLVEYADQVLLSSDAININVIAKDLGTSATSLNKKLVEMKVIYKSGPTYVLHSKYQSEGYTKTRTHYFTRKDGSQGTQVHTYWTEKGRQFIHSLFKKAA